MTAADDFDTDACAALAFEKVADEDLLRQFTTGPWKQECADAGITLRIAATLLEKTKLELIEVARGLGMENYFEVMDHLRAQEKRFRDLVEMLEAAQARLLVAGSAVSVEHRAEPVRGFGPIL